MVAIDLDHEVDAERLLRSDGVGALRVAEYVALQQHLAGGAVVIAAGGGIVDTPHVRALLRRALVVHLDVDADTCLGRLGRGDRSWLPAPDDPTRHNVFQQREHGRHHHRQQLAALSFHGDDKPGRVVDAIAAAVRSQPVGAVRQRDRSRSLGSDIGTATTGFQQPPGFAVVDAAVVKAHPEVRANCVIDVDASGKTLALAEHIATSWLASRQPGPLVAIGGGTLLDVAGLAAALVHRGRPWVAVPTTLMSMVDAAVGGKTAVDAHLPGDALGVRAKNQLGVFHRPSDVLVWPGFLSSLDAHLLRHGRAEMCKHGLLGGPGVDDDPAQHRDFKAAIVAIDPLDVHFRQSLNAGHTVGHALEVVCELPHGDAVWWGLRTELAHAVDRHRAPAAMLAAVDAAMIAAAVPALPPLSETTGQQIVQAMGHDKKGARWVMLRGGGCASIGHLDDDDRYKILQLLHQPLAFQRSSG
jgi:3-dehydroquinate synthetase/shikimate kinase